MESRQSGPALMDRRVAAAVWALALILAIASVQQCTASAVSVCSGLCTCTNQNFATVDCVFDGRSARPDAAPGASSVSQPQQTHFVLDDQLELPPSATALNIKLVGGGRLSFHKGFFKQNIINHLSIDGSESPKRAETRVEFHEGALCNNHGGFPEILVMNVDRLTMNKNISCAAHILNVTDVGTVWLKTEFLSVEEAEIFIENVHNLLIEAHAFRGSTSSKVQIHSTTIESLPKLGASFRLLSFNKCNISEIVSYAFDANEVEHVEFVNCRLTTLRRKAITDRLYSNSLIIRECNIKHIETQFVDGCGLKELQLEGNTIDEIAPGAFTYTSIYTTVTGNHIIRTGKDWLHPKKWTNVTVSGNSFGEFNGFSLGSAEDAKANCYFGNNTITNALPQSFTFARKCRIDAVHYGRECDCAYDSWLADLFGTTSPAATAAASCQVEESLRYCFNRSEMVSNDTTVTSSAPGRVNVSFFLAEFCQREGSIKCSSYSPGVGGGARQNGLKPPPLIPLEKIGSLGETNRDGFSGLTNTWLIAIIAGIVALAFVLFLTTYCYCRRRNEETHIPMTDQSSRQESMLPTPHQRSSSLTRGDKKIMENALRWLRDTYDQKVWSEINAPMQELLTKSSGAMGEQEKVRLIASILDSFERHNINGDKMVALNDILYRYLGPPASDSAQVGGTPTDTERQDPQGHIYAEVQPNRRPTTHDGLLGDYAAPLDHGAATTMPEGIYAEPILRNEHDQQLLQRGGNRHLLISPYAIGDATVQRNPTGGESGNLPDVILPRPRMRPPGRNNVEDDEDNEEDYDDEIDGEANERKTMLRPPDEDDAGAGGAVGPTYAISMKKLNRTARRDNTPLPPLPAPRTSPGTDESDGTDGNRSEHSGSSMQTVRIEDVTLADGTSEQQYDCNK